MKRRRIWISSPIYYALAVAMLCMAGISFYWSPIAFVVETVLAITACIVVLVGRKGLKRISEVPFGLPKMSLLHRITRR